MINKKRGFTLIEVLVAIAIIAILASLLLTGLKSANQKAKQARAKQSFQQIALAMQLYYDKYNIWPPAGIYPPAFVTTDKFYPNWNATWYCSTCNYYFFYTNGTDGKPKCGMIYIYGTGVFIYRYALCITSECGSTCGQKNF